MTDHTTHFDDCGCLRAKLEAERDAARADANAALDDAAEANACWQSTSAALLHEKDMRDAAEQERDRWKQLAHERLLMLKNGTVEATALESERDALRLAEKEVSDAYLRVRALLGAYDTAPGGTDRYEVTENAIKALRLRVAALEAAIVKARIQLDCPPQDMLDAAAALLNAHKMLAGDTTALRAMLVEAAKAGADNAYEDASSYASETEAGRLLWADGVADRILGASKGGGE